MPNGHRSTYRHEQRSTRPITTRRTDTGVVGRAGRKNHKVYP